jgi:hypothetical protein
VGVALGQAPGFLTVKKIDHAAFQRILGTDDEQAVVADQRFLNIRAMPKIIYRHANVCPNRLVEQRGVLRSCRHQWLHGRADAFDN